MVFYDSIFILNELGLEYMDKDEEHILWKFIYSIYEKYIKTAIESTH